MESYTLMTVSNIYVQAIDNPQSFAVFMPTLRPYAHSIHLYAVLIIIPRLHIENANLLSYINTNPFRPRMSIRNANCECGIASFVNKIRIKTFKCDVHNLCGLEI